MVLSNKKLKQKLRSVLAESQPNNQQHNDSHSFKSLLNSVTQKPILSKREIRRVKLPPNSEKENENELKRKRDKDVTEKNKKKKKKIKKSKVVVQKKKKNKEEQEEGLQKENEAVAIQPQTSKEDESMSTKIYVGGIPYYSTVDDIRSFFEGCGSITEIDCLKFTETGKFNGIAMISFRTDAAAKRALALDGSDMGGLSLKVQPYKATREKKVSDFAPAMLEGYNRIYVGNLSWDITEDELKKFFSDCSIISIRLGKDKETGEFKGFAHVDFADSLFLTMALKLDQKPLFGRPVRIRCAVPQKSVNAALKAEPAVTKDEGDVNDDVARKAKRQTCYDCGEKGHLSSSCPNKKAADVAHTSNITDDVAFDDNLGDGKLKRRTCYECGGKGHLSSSCPNKKVADVAHTGNWIDDVMFDKDEKEADYVSEGKLKRRTCYECGEKGHLSSACPITKAAGVAHTSIKTNAFDEVEADSIGDGKLKRRTCYECGEKGHLSSSCQKKQAADLVNTRPETFASAVVKYNVEVDYNMVNSVSDGKLRRRTCYECGERGHLSSACPKKQATDVTNPVKVANDMEVEKVNVAIVGKEASDNVVSEGKLRRRTCYECGERGHLSSLCPKKQTADVVSSGKEVDDMEVEEVKTMGAVSDGKLRRRICYECGLKGHVSSLCPNKLKTGITA